MAGCGGGTCGINKERQREKEAARRAARFALTAGENAPALGSPVDEIRALGEFLEGLLPVRAFVRLSDAPGGCDWLYLLAGVHPHSLFELGEGRDAEALRAEETYLRIGFSPLGPYVTLQEVTLALRDEPTGRVLVEDVRVGVEDTRLAYLVKGLQGALRKRRLVVLDAAFLVEPLEDGAPAVGSLLFEPGLPLVARVVAIEPVAGAHAGF